MVPSATPSAETPLVIPSVSLFFSIFDIARWRRSEPLTFSKYRACKSRGHVVSGVYGVYGGLLTAIGNISLLTTTTYYSTPCSYKIDPSMIISDQRQVMPKFTADE